MMLLFVILLLRPLCIATIAPTVQATSAGLTIEQGQAAYITEEVDIKCRWDPLVDSDSTYEIWLDDGARKRPLHKGNTSDRDVLTSSSYVHTLTTKNFSSGTYGCDIRSRNEFTSSTDAIYLFSSPHVQLVDLKREKDVYPGPSRSANFFCDVQDDTNQWTNICRVIEYRYRNGSDSSDKGTHSLSSAPGGDWQANGANLTIINVEELSVNVIVWCRVSRLRVCTDNVPPPSNGNFFWSKPVSIDVTPPPSPSPSHTPSPASSQSSVLGASIGSACVVIVALAALVVVVAIALIVVVVKRKNSQIQPTVRIPLGPDPEQGLPEYSIVRHPGNGQVSLTHLYLMHGEERPLGGCSSSHDPAQVEQLLPGAYCEPLVANDPQQHRQPGDGHA